MTGREKMEVEDATDATTTETAKLRERVEELEGTVAFLRTRRGTLVIERDAYQAHVESLIAAIENDGKTSSLHDWNARMTRAVADARKMAEGLRARATSNQKDRSNV